VAARDPKYAVPRVVGFSEQVLESGRVFRPADALGPEPMVPPRFRRGAPSLLECARRMDAANDFAALSLDCKVGCLWRRQQHALKPRTRGGLTKTWRAASWWCSSGW
jgi:hypothetical protein